MRTGSIQPGDIVYANKNGRLFHAAEDLHLRARDGMRDRELEAWRRMIAAHGPFAEARRVVSAAKAKKR
jgi:hypothetical protein